MTDEQEVEVLEYTADGSENDLRGGGVALLAWEGVGGGVMTGWSDDILPIKERGKSYTITRVNYFQQISNFLTFVTPESQGD